MTRLPRLQIYALALATLTGACNRTSPATTDAPAAAPGAATPAAATNPANDDLPPATSPYDALPPDVRDRLSKPFTGDFNQMVERRVIRAGVVFNRTYYFIDKGVQRGVTYEALKAIEEDLNQRLKTKQLKLHVAIVPLSREHLFSALQNGLVDFVVATLTVTPERQALAAFSTPTRTDVSEVVVTPKGAPPIASANDLSGREVFVRRTSSYHSSLQQLNQSLARDGKAPVTIKDAPEALEDDDILEMVNAGLVDVTIVDDFMVEFWRQVFPNIATHPDAAVRRGGNLAIAVRKDNPQMLAEVNRWVAKFGPRTAFGNIMEKRYLGDATYVKNAASEAERKKLLALVKLFETYSKQYNVDYLLMAAQGYQESGLDQSVKSHVGAVGVMQVMPATGAELKVGDISKLEPNIHAGVKYFRFMVDQYYKDEPMDDLNKALMTLASYNAGPGRMRKLRRETAERGLDPNVWFGNVERIVSERIGRETVTYVSNIYKYYIAYRLVMDQAVARERARTSAKP